MTQFASKTWDGALKVSSPFGDTTGRRAPHSGVDTVNRGPRYAPFAGRVTVDNAAPAFSGYGRRVQIVSDDGRFVYTLAHLNANSGVLVRKGDRVAIRQKLTNDMGIPTTGSSSGPHYHEQLTDNGRLVNLLDYLDGSYTGSSKPAGASAGWDGVSTLFKGKMGLAKGEDYYVLGPAGAGYLDSPGAVAAKYGLNLRDVLRWTDAAFPGQGFYANGVYYSGFKVALRDIVAKQRAERARVAEAAKAAEEQAATAADEAKAAADDAARSAEADAIIAEAAAAVERAEREAAAAAKAERERVVAEALQFLAGLEQAIDTIADTPAVIEPIRERVERLRPSTRKIVYEVGVWLGVAGTAIAATAAVLTGEAELFAGAVGGVLLAVSNALAKANVNPEPEIES